MRKIGYLQIKPDQKLRRIISVWWAKVLNYRLIHDTVYLCRNSQTLLFCIGIVFILYLFKRCIRSLNLFSTHMQRAARARGNSEWSKSRCGQWRFNPVFRLSQIEIWLNCNCAHLELNHSDLFKAFVARSYPYLDFNLLVGPITLRSSRQMIPNSVLKSWGPMTSCIGSRQTS